MHVNLWRVALALELMALGACGPALTWTARPSKPAGAAAAKPRPAGCPFDILITGSPRPSVVLGVIEIDAFSVRAIPNDEAELRRVLGAEVCRVGGDAVVAAATGSGRFVLATVLKYTADSPALPAAAAPGGDS